MPTSSAAAAEEHTWGISTYGIFIWYPWCATCGTEPNASLMQQAEAFPRLCKGWRSPHFLFAPPAIIAFDSFFSHYNELSDIKSRGTVGEHHKSAFLSFLEETNKNLGLIPLANMGTAHELPAWIRNEAFKHWKVAIRTLNLGSDSKMAAWRSQLPAGTLRC